MPYPWNTGDELLAADLNAAIANAGSAPGAPGPPGPPGPPGSTDWQGGLVTGLGTHLTLVAGSLDAVPSQWQVGPANSLGTGLTLTGGVLAVTGTSSSPPSGPAGGDLGGNYPNPTALKTNGTAFAASATTDTTNASNITTGTLSVSLFNGGAAASAFTYLRGDGTWSVPAAGVAPIGPAGGDLGGAYPNPLVLKTNGVAFANSATIDTTNASNINAGTLAAARLAASGVTPGAYALASITVDAAGRVTAATANTMGGVTSIATGPGLSGGPITTAGTINANWQLGTVTALGAGLQIAATTLQLPATGVAAGSYTSTNITVDATGRITAASSGSKGGAGTGTVTSITAGTGLSGGTITTTGTIGLAASGVAPGTYTNSTVTVDATGRVTTASSGAGGSTGTVTNIATTGTGISGGPITTTGTLSVAWNAGTVSTLSGLTLTSGTLTAAPAFSAVTGTATFAQLPAEVQQVPISFPFSGKPNTGAIVNVPMAMALTVPASLAGTTVYDTTKATSNAVFTVNRITGGTTITAIGTVTVTSTSNTSATLAGSGATMAAGDVLQVVAPTQDATLADVSFTLLCARI